jgi:hypothetical protein
VTTSPDDIEVIHMTAVEWDQALTNSLNALGLTWEQLTEQAKTGDFSSLKARQLWLMAGGQGPNQAGEGLRDRLRKALEPCEPFDHALTEKVLAVLAERSGDLYEQVLREIRVSLRQWDAMGIGGRPGVTLADFLAASVLALPAVAAAEARAVFAEGELSALRDHCARWETEKARADKAEAERDALKRVTDPPADDEGMPTDPAELREMWDFINRQARWQWHMATKFNSKLERLRAEAIKTAAERQAHIVDLRKRLEWNIDQADKQFRARREAEAKLHEVAMVKVWTNEDGKRFVFVDDLTPILLPDTAPVL